MTNRDRRADDTVIGWREWVTFLEPGLPPIKAKVDTGARSSSLHATGIRTFKRGEHAYAKFTVHPVQHDDETSAEVEAVLLGKRAVRDSGGRVTVRPVVHSTVSLHGRAWPMELTLTNRDSMGFRMLLGREAIRGRFVIDPARSYLSARPPRRERGTSLAPETMDEVAPARERVME